MNPEHIEQSVSPDNFGNTPQLPKELLRYVSIDRLHHNAQGYPEMGVELTEAQGEKVKIIKEVLAQIPLIHATSNEQIAKGLADITPSDDLSEGHRNHSLESDRSLGLTKCVFFNWGMAQKGYGSLIAQFSPQLLDRDNVFVTPMDIGQIEFADDIPFDEFDATRKERVDQYYFGQMVTGKDWQEIIARRILQTVESGHTFYPLHSSYSLGEIKHFGTVSKSDSVGSFSTSDSDLSSHYRFLYEHGFSFANIEQNRAEFLKTGRVMGVDPTPEECGIDYEKASHFWEKTLDLKI